MSTSSAYKNEDIEILRAFAIILTIVLHLQVVTLIPSDALTWIYGNFELAIGVYLFFVISGYVITRSFSDSLDKATSGRRKALYAFWIKRIYRLLPTATLWLGVLCVDWVLVTLYFGHEPDFRSLLPVLAALLNVMNLYGAHCALSGNSVDSLFCGIFFFNGHYWSLSLEEQFYLVFPLLFCFLRSKFLACGLLVVIVVLMFWHRPLYSYGWFFRLDALCWGVLLGLFSKHRLYRSITPFFLSSGLLATVVSCGLLLAFPLISLDLVGRPSKTYGLAGVAFMSMILVWLASYNKGLFGGYQPYRRLMLYLGARSYSLYVSHLIIFYILNRLLVLSGLIELVAESGAIANYVVMIISLVLVLVLSEVNYRFVEEGLRDRGRQIAELVSQDR